jgi:hypothetical protein
MTALGTGREKSKDCLLWSGIERKVELEREDKGEEGSHPEDISFVFCFY